MYCLILTFVIIGLFGTLPDEEIQFRSDGNGIWAFSKETAKPVWSREGLLYRERYDRSVGKEMYDFPSRAFVESEEQEIPMLCKHGRLYGILSKYPPRSRLGLVDVDKRTGNVLVALDLETEGQLVFLIDSATLIYDGKRQNRFQAIRSLDGDVLTVETIDGTLIGIDVSTGCVAQGASANP